MDFPTRKKRKTSLSNKSSDINHGTHKNEGPSEKRLEAGSNNQSACKQESTEEPGPSRSMKRRGTPSFKSPLPLKKAATSVEEPEEPLSDVDIRFDPNKQTSSESAKQATSNKKHSLRLQNNESPKTSHKDNSSPEEDELPPPSPPLAEEESSILTFYPMSQEPALVYWDWRKGSTKRHFVIKKQKLIPPSFTVPEDVQEDSEAKRRKVIENSQEVIEESFDEFAMLERRLATEHINSQDDGPEQSFDHSYDYLTFDSPDAGKKESDEETCPDIVASSTTELKSPPGLEKCESQSCSKFPLSAKDTLPLCQTLKNTNSLNKESDDTPITRLTQSKTIVQDKGNGDSSNLVVNEKEPDLMSPLRSAFYQDDSITECLIACSIQAEEECKNNEWKNPKSESVQKCNEERKTLTSTPRSNAHEFQVPKISTSTPVSHSSSKAVHVAITPPVHSSKLQRKTNGEENQRNKNNSVSCSRGLEFVNSFPAHSGSRSTRTSLPKIPTTAESGIKITPVVPQRKSPRVAASSQKTVHRKMSVPSPRKNPVVASTTAPDADFNPSWMESIRLATSPLNTSLTSRSFTQNTTENKKSVSPKKAEEKIQENKIISRTLFSQQGKPEKPLINSNTSNTFNVNAKISQSIVLPPAKVSEDESKPDLNKSYDPFDDSLDSALSAIEKIEAQYLSQMEQQSQKAGKNPSVNDAKTILSKTTVVNESKTNNTNKPGIESKSNSICITNRCDARNQVLDQPKGKFISQFKQTPLPSKFTSENFNTSSLTSKIINNNPPKSVANTRAPISQSVKSASSNSTQTQSFQNRNTNLNSVTASNTGMTSNINLSSVTASNTGMISNINLNSVTASNTGMTSNINLGSVTASNTGMTSKINPKEHLPSSSLNKNLPACKVPPSTQQISSVTPNASAALQNPGRHLVQSVSSLHSVPSKVPGSISNLISQSSRTTTLQSSAIKTNISSNSTTSKLNLTNINNNNLVKTQIFSNSLNKFSQSTQQNKVQHISNMQRNVGEKSGIENKTSYQQTNNLAYNNMRSNMQSSGSIISKNCNPVVPKIPYHQTISGSSLIRHKSADFSPKTATVVRPAPANIQQLKSNAASPLVRHRSAGDCSTLQGSQPKYTVEEIERKRQEARQRLQQRKLMQEQQKSRS